jgi:hypothetical protein
LKIREVIWERIKGWVGNARLLIIVTSAFFAAHQAAFAACVTNTSNPGCVHFLMRPDPNFSQYIQSPTAAQEAWFRAHFWEWMEFSPSFNHKLSWFPNALVYVNLWGIVTTDPLVHEHPEWILKDAHGNWMFINSTA